VWFNHIASGIVNAKSQHYVIDCGVRRIQLRSRRHRLAIPEPTERQRIGNQIDAAFIPCAGGLRKRASVMRHSITKSY